MKKIIGFIFMILTCFYNTCFADIIQTNDTKIIEKTIASIDQDTLVIFDVDVLIMPKDQILQSHHREYINKLDTFLFASENDLSALLNMEYIAAYLLTFGILALIVTVLFIKNLSPIAVCMRILAGS